MSAARARRRRCRYPRQDPPPQAARPPLPRHPLGPRTRRSRHDAPLAPPKRGRSLRLGRGARDHRLRRSRRRRCGGVRPAADLHPRRIHRAHARAASVPRMAQRARRPAALPARRGTVGARPDPHAAVAARRSATAAPAADVDDRRRRRVRGDDPHPARSHRARALQVDLGDPRSRPADLAAAAGHRPRDQRRAHLDRRLALQLRAVGGREDPPRRVLRRVPRGVPRGHHAFPAHRAVPDPAGALPAAHPRDVGDGDGRRHLREGPGGGAPILLALYLLFFYRGMLIAVRAPTPFLQLLAGGLSFIVAFQTLVIVGGNARLIPLTGVTLPFVAYGGSSLVTNWMLVALLMRVSDLTARVRGTE